MGLFNTLKKQEQPASTRGKIALEQVANELERLATMQGTDAPATEQLTAPNTQAGILAGAGVESISDDIGASGEGLLNIEREEAFARDLLTLFNISYDQLIAMDGKSFYSKAIAANPALLDAVKGAPNPVVAALSIALQFEPYAEFTNKYGENPADIKAAIRDEVIAEMKTAAKGGGADAAATGQTVAQSITPVFGKAFGQIPNQKAKASKVDLNTVFKS